MAQEQMARRMMVLEEILTEKQIHHVLKQIFGNVTWHLKGSEVRPAADGMAGFLGDHMRALLEVDVDGEEKKVHLFMKRVSIDNKPKADYIHENNFYKREMLMYEMLEELCEEDQRPWCVKAYLYTDSIIVMPDLTLQGYSSRNFLVTLDSEHIFLTTTTLARFHAAFVNYEIKKSIELKHTYSIYREFGHILAESHFCDSPWLRACPKVSAKILQKFSTKSFRNLPNLELKLTQLFLDACDNLTEYDDTVNVVLHRDLWVNNIMFQYDKNLPINAVLVDYQCLRYGPPAFDLMLFLYLTTDKTFRHEREKDVFNHYYSTFIMNLNAESREKIIHLGYDKDNFLKWCEKGRMFGMVEAITFYPYILMDPKTAQKTFDDPETFEKYLNEDRSEPVIAHAMKCEAYKHRNLEINEEFIEKYVLK